MYTAELTFEDIENLRKEEGREEGAKGIIKIALKFDRNKDFIVENLVKELNITLQKAEEYYEKYSK